MKLKKTKIKKLKLKIHIRMTTPNMARCGGTNRKALYNAGRNAN